MGIEVGQVDRGPKALSIKGLSEHFYSSLFIITLLSFYPGLDIVSYWCNLIKTQLTGVKSLCSTVLGR